MTGDNEHQYRVTHPDGFYPYAACSCGWLGPGFENPDNGRMAHKKHVERIANGEKE